MSYRPYPNADRARRQVARHDDETPPLPDGAESPAARIFPRLVISDEAREAMGARMAEVGASLRHGFLAPEGVREAMRRTLPVKASLRPLAEVLAKRPAGSEETTT